jgi:hypothetical protein
MAPTAGLAQTNPVEPNSEPARACYVPRSGTMYRIKTEQAPPACTSPDHIEFTLGGSAGMAGAKGVGGGTSDHGALAGLLDDDHPQYLLSDGVRNSVNGFAVTGTLGTGAIPATGAGTRLMWYPAKAAFRAGTIHQGFWDDANIGNASVAMGLRAIAVGDASIALGQNTYATGVGAAAIGHTAFATGDGSTALGLGTLASGRGAMAFGENSKAGGWSATAGGHSSDASGDLSVAIGNGTTASGWSSVALGHQANTNGQAGAVVISSITGGLVSGEVKAVAPGQFVMRASRFWIGNNANVTAQPGQLIVTSTGAFLSVGGAWVNSSDVNRKENFAQVDGESVLNKLAVLPIQSWNYRDEDSTTRHVGPTAQDFRAAFGLGANETAIATVDADGVALAALQALERRTREQGRKIQELRSALEQLREQLEQRPRDSNP